MISLSYFTALLAAAAFQQTSPTPATNKALPDAVTIMQKVEQSGRCATIGKTPEQRLTKRPVIAPGAPPVLSFKLYEDAKHHRFGNVDVMLDDAGH